jgi:hypothetical protein
VTLKEQLNYKVAVIPFFRCSFRLVVVVTVLDKALECLSAGLKPFVVGCDLVGCNFFCGSGIFGGGESRAIFGTFCAASGATSILYP